MINSDNYDSIKSKTIATISLQPITWFEIDEEEVFLYIPASQNKYCVGVKTLNKSINKIINGRLTNEEELQDIDCYVLVNLNYFDNDTYKKVRYKYALTPSTAEKIRNKFDTGDLEVEVDVLKKFLICNFQNSADGLFFCTSCNKYVSEMNCNEKPIESGIISTELDVDDNTVEMENCMNQILTTGSIDSNINLEILDALELLGIVYRRQGDGNNLALSKFGKKIYQLLITQD